MTFYVYISTDIPFVRGLRFHVQAEESHDSQVLHDKIFTESENIEAHPVRKHLCRASTSIIRRSELKI